MVYGSRWSGTKVPIPLPNVDGLETPPDARKSEVEGLVFVNVFNRELGENNNPFP